MCDSTCGGGVALSIRECIDTQKGTALEDAACDGNSTRSTYNCAPEDCPCNISHRLVNSACTSNFILFAVKYVVLIGGENNPSRVDVFPIEGAPECPAAPPQFSLASSGQGLSGGRVDNVPFVCGEAGVDYVCHKLEDGAAQWSPVESGVRSLEAAMVVFDGESKVLAIGGR